MDILLFIRDAILLIGWPFLIAGSIFLLMRGYRFYKGVKKDILGVLILRLLSALVITMFSLGVVATIFMLSAHAELAVLVVLPIFMLWFVTLVSILFSVPKFEDEVLRREISGETLRKIVDEKTKELDKQKRRSEKTTEEMKSLQKDIDRFNLLANVMVGREEKIKELKDEVNQLRSESMP